MDATDCAIFEMLQEGGRISISDLTQNVFIRVTLTRQKCRELSVFETAVIKSRHVTECYLMTGDHDYLVRVATADTVEYERFYKNFLTRLPHVDHLRSSFGLRTAQEDGLARPVCASIETLTAYA